MPPDQLADTLACKPAACDGRGHALDGSDPRPIRHQVAEVPPIRPEVIEYQLHRLACPGCGKTTRASLPEGVPAGSFGPRLRAMLSLLAAEFRLAKRPVQRLARTMLGLDISLGMVAKLERQTATVLGPVDEGLARAVRSAPAAHIDETPWRQANAKAWPWVGTGAGVTHFRIAPDRKAQTARLILGEAPEKVAVRDRFSAYGWVEQHQYCWSQDRRDRHAARVAEYRAAQSAAVPQLTGPRVLDGPADLLASIDAMVAAGIARCDLCGSREIHAVGLFQGDPQAQKLIGAPVGKLRLLPYLVCRECAAEPATPQRAEDAVLERFQRRRQVVEGN